MNRGEAASIRRPFARPVDRLAPIAAGRRPGYRSAVVIAPGAIALRVSLAPQFDGLDDAWYTSRRRSGSATAVRSITCSRCFGRVSAWPIRFGWLLDAGWLQPDQFWILTITAECDDADVAVRRGLAAGRHGNASVSPRLSLYAIYPLAIQQSSMYYPDRVPGGVDRGRVRAHRARANGVDRARADAVRDSRPACRSVLATSFKEDVAIVVPAMALASLIARFPRVGDRRRGVRRRRRRVLRSSARAIGRRPAIRCFGWPRRRDASAPPAVQLQIAEIWRWDAYLRSLLVHAGCESASHGGWRFRPCGRRGDRASRACCSSPCCS